MRVFVPAHRAGDGVDDTDVDHGGGTGLPAVTVSFCKRVDSGSSQRMVFRTPDNAAGESLFLSGAGAQTDRIQATNGDPTPGHQVGTAAQVNNNAGTYNDIFLLADSGVLEEFTYVGDAVDDRQITLSFQPDIVVVKRVGSTNGVMTTDKFTVGESKDLDGGTFNTGNIKTLNGTGFTVGTAAATNASGATYIGFALKAKAGVISTFTYTGDGVDNNTEAHGLTAAPDMVVIARDGAAGPFYKDSSTGNDDSYDFDSNTSIADGIKSTDATNVTLGTNVRVNDNGTEYQGWAIRDDLGTGGAHLRLGLLGVG